jgi:2-desacetyl-2-hydroxyethyl bacteriochlorophyllide A dehydrogenase
MQTLVYTAPNRIELQDTPRPPPHAGSVRLRVDAVGICGSDLHAFKGHDPRRQPPLVLGHEFVGTALDGAHAGRRFTANPLVTCGKCRYCLQGRGNLCSDRGMIGMNLPGAFADELAVPLACLVEVPATLSDRGAALTEPAATVVHVLALAARACAQPLHEARTLVLGAGAIGLLAALALQHRGVPELAVVETNPLRAQALRQATGIAAIDAPAAAARAGEFDVVFDAVGVAATRELAIASSAPGGVVAHVGLGDWTSPLDWRGLTLREITLIGCYTYTTADMHGAVAALARGEFGDLAWVEELALADGPAAFADLVSGRVAAAKILLRPHAGS